MRIYLDTCCLSRFFDVQAQTRIYQETETIRRIISHIRSGNLYWISSDVLLHEIEQNSDLDQRTQILDIVSDVHQTVPVGISEISRGKKLENLGFKKLDALHIACAESGSTDIFLTTDVRLLRTVKRHSLQLYVRVENPYIWFHEVKGNERIRNDG